MGRALHGVDQRPPESPDLERVDPGDRGPSGVSLAGIPPTAGFIGKFYVFMAAVEAGLTWLAVVALIFAAVSAYYYMRVVMLMYMREPDASIVEPPHLVASPALSIVLACAVAGVIIFGLFPNPVVSLALQSVLSLK